MPKTNKRVVAVVIVAVGVLGALPFLQRSPVAHAPPAKASPALEPAPDVTLHMGTESATSPAVGLRDDEAEYSPALSAPAITRSRLEEHGLPPELPERYQPLIQNSLPGREVGLEQPRVRPALPQERTHRIVDGDTLPRLAERYWQDASLADALWEANRSVLLSPDPLPLGVTIRIPARPASRATPASARPEMFRAPVRQP